MAGIATPPAEGRWDIAVWDGGPDGAPLGVWDGDNNVSGLTLLMPGTASSYTRPGTATITTRAGSAQRTSRREGSAAGGGRE